MLGSRLALVWFLATGCAEIGDPPTIDSDGGSSPVDVTLAQHLDDQIAPATSPSCRNNETLFHTDNSYYRTFDPADFDISSAIAIRRVEIGVEVALGSDGSQPLTVRIHRLVGAIEDGVLTQAAQTTVNVVDQELSTVEVPIDATIGAGLLFAVEVFTPDGTELGNRFVLGANTGGQRSPSYLRADACSDAADRPRDLAAINPDFADVAWVVTVHAQTNKPVK